MLTGRLLIDNLDAFTAYGVIITEGSYKSLLAYPPLKIPESIDWQEDDGVEVDLSSVALNSSSASLNFCCIDNRKHDIVSLLDALSDGVYHNFDFVEISRSYRLRLIGSTAFKTQGCLDTFTLSFENDAPLAEYTYAPPISTCVNSSDEFMLDSKPFSYWGVQVLSGTEDSIMKPSLVKENMKREFKAITGIVYDGGGYVRYKSRDVKVNCLMMAYDYPSLWRNYDALLFDLSRNGEHEISVRDRGLFLRCYYKSSTVSNFLPIEGRVRAWLQFSLVFTLIDSRVTRGDIYLMTEDGEYSSTEEDKTIVLR